MAFESFYWRKKIKRNITEIKKMLNVNLDVLESEKADKIFSEVEIGIFIMAFSLRKLLETRKLPDAVADEVIQVIKFPRNNESKGWAFDFERLYDFAKPVSEDLSLKYFLNQIIHAHVFQAAVISNKNISHLYFTSDKTRKRWIYYIKVESLLKFFEKISKQNVMHMEIEYNVGAGEYITKTR